MASNSTSAGTEYIGMNFRQIVQNLSDSKILSLPENIISLSDKEINRTLASFKGSSLDFEGKPIEEVNAPENTMRMLKIDKVLRDLLFFDKDLYKDVVVKKSSK